MAINAEEARRLSESEISPEVLAAYTDRIDAAITIAAKLGGRGIDPWGHISIGKPNPIKQRAIQREYESRGFKWEEHHDQREGRSWTTLSW